jgi:phospholipid/cholesterol/gamma-HCH transport system substrate-binding protein
MRRVRIAAFTALVVLAAATIAITIERDATPYRVSFVFADAGGLREGGDIRVRGIRAGRIDAVQLIAGDRALVRGHLFEGVGSLRSGASASSRPTGLLGEQFVDLALGRGPQRLPSGSRISLARTGKAVSLGDVLDVLDAPTRARLQILIADAGAGLAGRGTDLRRLLAALPDTTRQLDLVVGQLQRRRVELRRLIGRSDELLTPVAGKRTDLGALADAASGALRLAASRRVALAKTVDRAPAALARLSTTLTALGDTAQQLRPTAKQLSAAAPQVGRVLAALPAFRRDVRTVLATAATVSPRITRFARKARRPVRQLDDVAGGLGRFAATIAPVVDVLGDGGTNQLLRFFDGFAQVMEERDGIGNLIRIRTILGPLKDAKPSPDGRRVRPKRTPGRTPDTPDVSPPASPRPTLSDAVPKLVPTVTKAVNDVLDFLLKP